MKNMFATLYNETNHMKSRFLDGKELNFLIDMLFEEKLGFLCLLTAFYHWSFLVFFDIFIGVF
jgi:hypothetical protein